MPQNDLVKDFAYDAFISYSSKNKAVADALCHFLEENRIRCWMAPRDILPGKEYGEVIDQAIREAQIFVLVCSNDSLNSNWVRKETNLAVSGGRIIIPFRIEDCALKGAMKMYLNDVHWIVAFPDPEQAFGPLADAISAKLRSPILPRSDSLFSAKIANRKNAYASREDLTNVLIPDGVVKIGANAFENCKKLSSINISSCVTEIGEEAFADCTGLTSINILSGGKRNGVTKIGERTFAGCTRLTSIVIPTGVTKIGMGTFENCKGLTSVVIHDSVSEISDRAFAGCTGLTSIKIPSSVAKIGAEAFGYCRGLTSIEIHAGVTEIGAGAFEHCRQLTSIEIPSGVAKIGEKAFGCSGLTSVVIPDSVTEIGNDAFKGCTKLTSVVISNRKTEIGKDAFAGCEQLISIGILTPYGLIKINRKALAKGRSGLIKCLFGIM